jgi:hypothetical protein
VQHRSLGLDLLILARTILLMMLRPEQSVYERMPAPSHKDGTRANFGRRFMSIAELILPQYLAEQCAGSFLEDYERRRVQHGEFWAGWWLVKETLYSLGPIVSGRLSKLVLLLLGYLGYRHAADLLAKLIGR